MDHKRQLLLDSLYTICQDRSLSSKEVLSKLIEKLNISIPTNVSQDKLLDLVRNYKNTGKNLEFTLNSLYDMLYQKDFLDFGAKDTWD